MATHIHDVLPSTQSTQAIRDCLIQTAATLGTPIKGEFVVGEPNHYLVVVNGAVDCNVAYQVEHLGALYFHTAPLELIQILTDSRIQWGRKSPFRERDSYIFEQRKPNKCKTYDHMVKTEGEVVQHFERVVGVAYYA